MALFGCTFTNRKVGSRDMGAALRTLLGDGIISGMALSKSGAVLSIAKGYMIACGRIIGNDASLSLSMTQSSGYARVVIKIDLTGTATASTFAQLSTRIDYASTADGFSALVQDDVNDGTHTTYEVALCILKLNSSGIDSVVAKLPAAALAAGSVGYSQLMPGAVTASRLSDGAVGIAQLAPGAVTSEKLAASVRPADVGIRHGTATPTTTTCPSGCVYLKHS